MSSLIAGLACVAVGIGGYLGRPLRLETTLIGCGVFHADGLCELAADRQLRVLIETEPEVAISVLDGMLPLRPQATEWVDRGRLFNLTIPSRHRSLYVLMRRGLRWRLRKLAIGESRAPEWLRDAQQKWRMNQSALAQQILRAKLKEQISPEQRAAALGILARIAREWDRSDDARQLFTEALIADRQAQLVSNELDDVMSLARLLNRRYHQPVVAEELWKTRQALLEKMPEMIPWKSLHLSIYRQKAGDMRAAMSFVEEGKLLARRFGDLEVLAELISQQATLLNQMGRLSDSEAALQEQVGGDSDACRRAELLADQAWLRIMARMALRPEAPPDPKYDAQPLLDSALTLVRMRCQQPNLMAKLLTYRGHSALLAHQYQAAEAQVEQARLALKSKDPNIEHPSPELELEWFDIKGRAAIGQQHWQLAQQSYKTMLARSRRMDDFEAVWRANIGLAWASEEEDPQEARRLYQAAESYLDERSLSIPLGTGRGTFLGRFEWGTRLYVDLLHRLDRDAEAMTVVRHARARGLWVLSLTERIARIDSATRARWDGALAKYVDARREHDRSVAATNGASLANSAAAQKQERAQTQRLLASLEAALIVLGERPEQPLFQPPGLHEVILACHPARTGWLCFAADRAGIQSTRLDRLDVNVPYEQLTQQLLAPFARMLKDARRVRVIAYGELRQVDIHRLALAGQPLGDSREVVYALDAPWYAPIREEVGKADAPGQGLAVLVFDPNETLSESRRSASAIVKLMRAAHWQLRVQVGSEVVPE